MDILHETQSRKSFLSHVFSTSEEGKAEVLNVLQYAVLGVVPVVVLNKLVQRFIPEADAEKSSLEILVEVLLQILVMFSGILLIHRMITFLPTYSGAKYDTMVLTNVVLAFLIIVLSIQTKLGIKVNILVDRLGELWHGPDKAAAVPNKRGSHVPSPADFLDSSSMQQDLFPPAPKATAAAGGPAAAAAAMHEPGPMAANGVLGGGGFGTFF
jgi:hypothetical protein